MRRYGSGFGRPVLVDDEVCERGFDKKLGTFVQAYGSDQLDASLAATTFKIDETLKQQLDEITHEYRMGDAPR